MPTLKCGCVIDKKTKRIKVKCEEHTWDFKSPPKKGPGTQLTEANLTMQVYRNYD